MGFIGVLSVHGITPRILPITKAAFDWCPEIQKQDGKLRGLGLVARRVGQTPQSPLKIELRRPNVADAIHPKDHLIDVPQALARIWHCDWIVNPDSTQDEEAIPCR